MKTKVKEILSQLTLEEKYELCAQKEGSFGRVERLGLKGNVPQDNPRNGEDYLRSGKPVEGDGKYHPVAFPSAAALGMSWDTDLAYETGVNFALECRANPELVSWLFRPGVNLKRHPLCGRNFEYLSEDPVVSGELAGSYIQGLQSQGVAATLKHYICNDQEFERMTTNSQLSERALREVHLRAFEIAIRKGRPKSIMTSYNKVNGEWVNSNPHVMELLRRELGFDGVVVSDFAAIHRTKTAAHQCGMDIELAPVECHSGELMEAVKRGEVSEELIDEELGRVFDLCDTLYETTPVTIDMDEFHKKAEKAAEQCMVLLENDGILPLEAKQENLLVLGALAENPSYMGGGSGHMNGYQVDKPLEKIREFAPEANFQPGYQLIEDFPPVDQPDPALVKQAVEAAGQAGTVIVFAGPGYCTESEGYDRKDILLPKSQRMLLDGVLKVNNNVILVVSCASVIDLSEYTGKVRAILYSSLTGEAFGGAAANILFGKAEPGGRLAETWPVRLEHTPAYLNFCGPCEDRETVLYGEDVFIGYRWYEARKLPVLYPFGHGLSYTSFEITDIAVDKKTLTPDDTLKVSCRVKNTGNRPGSQVIQVYVADKESIVRRPEKELKAFAKVALAPGEKQAVSLSLGREEFRLFSERQNQWLVEDGVFEILVATDAQSIAGREEVLMTGGDVPFVYNEMTALVWFEQSGKFRRILKEHFSQEINDFFDQKKNEWCVLLYPLPIYRLAEPLLGNSLLSEEEIQFIIEKMNA